MYQAKSAGETYRRYDPSDDRFTVRRLKLLGELPRALREEELVVHYQPKIDLRAATVVGVEALVRWNHPEHGMVPPERRRHIARDPLGDLRDVVASVGAPCPNCDRYYIGPATPLCPNCGTHYDAGE